MDTGQSVKLCVFDLDGTLVNTIGDIADSANFALQKNGFPQHPEAAYYQFVGNGTPKLIERMLVGVPHNEADAERVYHDYAAYYTEHSMDRSKPYDGVYELLSRLRQAGVKCGVLSNKSEQFSREMVARLFPDYPFIKISGDREGVKLKPNPDELLSFLHDTGVTKAEAVMIGDTNVDMLTAQNAGIRCIGAAWGFRGREELTRASADCIAERPEDCISLLLPQNEA